VRVGVKRATGKLEAPTEKRRNRRLIARVRTLQTERAKAKEAQS